MIIHVMGMDPAHISKEGKDLSFLGSKLRNEDFEFKVESTEIKAYL